MTDLRVEDDPAGAAAERLAEAVRGGGHVALAGGSTPAAAYERVAGMGLDWSGATLWFGDERCVPAEHEHSNFRMARETLLDRIEGSPPGVHRMAGELGPDEGAADYELQLREAFGAGLPELDLVILGLGPDAHTASLFPGRPEIDERERLATGVAEPGMEPLVPRVTLTLPVLNAAREVLFLVSGESKAEAVARAFGDGAPSREAPASLVAPVPGRLTVMLDAAASGRLQP